jgi:hypothetical protein
MAVNKVSPLLEILLSFRYAGRLSFNQGVEPGFANTQRLGYSTLRFGCVVGHFMPYRRFPSPWSLRPHERNPTPEE